MLSQARVGNCPGECESLSDRSFVYRTDLTSIPEAPLPLPTIPRQADKIATSQSFCATGAVCCLRTSLAVSLFEIYSQVFVLWDTPAAGWRFVFCGAPCRRALKILSFGNPFLRKRECLFMMMTQLVQQGFPFCLLVWNGSGSFNFNSGCFCPSLACCAALICQQMKTPQTCSVQLISGTYKPTEHESCMKQCTFFEWRDRAQLLSNTITVTPSWC